MSLLTDQQLAELAAEHRRAGRLSEAEAIYRRLLGAYPQHPDLTHEVGVLLFQAGRHSEARPWLEQAVALSPARADYYNNLGLVLQELGEFEKAIAAYESAAHLDPGLAIASYNLGNTYRRMQQWDAAIACFRRSLASQPEHVNFHINLALTLLAHGSVETSIEVLRAALAKFPRDGRLWNNLGTILHDQSDLEGALSAFRQALDCNPDSPLSRNNLGGTFKELGLLDEALAAFRSSLALQPRQTDVHSNIILTLHLHPDSTPAIIAAECARWQAQHAAPLRAWRRPFTNNRDPERRLRIGYVSPDFRAHPVGRQLLPLFRAHDPRQVEIVSYATSSTADDFTAKFRATAAEWSEAAALSDDQLAERIFQDRIDVLVDLSVHTGGNRLRVFARQPAPVQVTFAGYPGCTGLHAIDYRLTDRFLDPPGPADAQAFERPFRLPDSFWCFDPLEETPEVTPLPALAGAAMVFGCLHNFGKVNARVLTLWARILNAVPNSRLRLLCPSGKSRARILAQGAQLGLAPERFDFVAYQPRSAFLAEHQRIDIILDTFPYNGHVTVCDALWMGVPVISLAGALPVSRGGLSILSNIGLPELVASSEDEYVRLAVELARDLPRLAALRAGLRARLQASPLTDAPRFARGIEAAFREMWRRWCAPEAKS